MTRAKRASSSRTKSPNAAALPLPGVAPPASSRVLTVGITTVLGLLAGSLLWSLATRSFRWEGFGGVEDTANHLIGAALMGFGGVTALGCTIGQGLSGVSTLALGSFLALAAIIAGAVAALKFQYWRIMREA